MKAWVKAIVGILAISMIAILAGCGSDESATDPNVVNIFIMGKDGFPQQYADAIGKNLQQKLGANMKVIVSTTPVYSAEKLVLEYVDRKDDIIILPEADMKGYALNGGHMVLDHDFDAKTYKGGVTKGAANENDTDQAKQTDHLFAIPVSQMSAFKAIGYKGDDLYATIPIFANHDKAVKVLKALTE
ncbi:hypothetical protein [Paenibacillus campi]|uniref:hypothetical protein n=1 Tax=Paenibacillus campi TaxID=3106031 RepID=UPI002AFF5327|nr:MULTISPECIES: hypothetical protein [unclassified Paenibacillus]